ncbi:SusD/RagB family nutrient-binding outer membrane lipoprotein [Pedobacter riviphilus]|uniref:SusD/RagB family nutrient-binding outer membrane lipoprotein n=1 Tax=Pedobacter riviphilus TaxID=2766984 RepID=A0ABX6TDW3_9SPHI|nr:RagB/SusD family nutrient uptake outer membrane protein [Pedobacter riviphilus]QNR83141.1 SusD/RagB family nutrient-binding outer membrane lipoprotein [Pedobacter riviphilus]
MKYLNKTTKITTVFAMALVTLFSACTKNFEEYNTNPNGLTSEDLLKDNLGAGSFIPTMQVNVIYNKPQDNWKYQVQQNLTADTYSGYFATPGGFGGPNTTTYDFVAKNWNIWAFQIAYSGIMGSWKEIKNRAANAPQVVAVADILKVEGMHRVTDTYGPIPYSKFGVNALTTPYDDQQTVYNTFFQDLDNAIKVLSDYVTKNPTDNGLSKFDLVYNGDYKQWIKFANSLKLRLAIRIAYANRTLAQTKAEEAVNNSYGLLSANTDNALVLPGKGITTSNGLWVADQAYDDCRMNASIESILKGYNDNRLTKYFQVSKITPGDYRGIRNGITISGNKPDGYLKASSTTLKESTPVQYMCAAEVAFLRAEGALLHWNMGGSAQSFYEQGIKLSFEQYGASGVDAYIANNTGTQAAYTDPANVAANNVAPGSPLLSKTTVKWDETAADEVKLEKIITQKWIAIFPDGQEAWTEFRRTGYPKIFPVVTNLSGGLIDTQKQIRRVPFSPDEYKSNNAEVVKAVALLGGPDNGGTKLWWDKKP